MLWAFFIDSTPCSRKHSSLLAEIQMIDQAAGRRVTLEETEQAGEMEAGVRRKF